MVAAFLTRVHVFGLYVHYHSPLQTLFDLLFSIIMNCYVRYSVLYENLTCSSGITSWTVLSRTGLNASNDD